MPPIARNLSAVLLFAALPLCLYAAIAHEPLSAPHAIAPGITYSVESLPPDPNGHGRIYLARTKLDATQLELFITPPDPAADGTTWTHRLTPVWHAARAHQLAVAINASTFAGGSFPIRRPGQRARTVETTIVSGQVVSLWEHTYLLGFHADLTPEPCNKPPPPDKIPTFRWAVGAQSWNASNGQFNPGAGEGAIDATTAVGVNPDTREFFLAVFDHASQGRAARELLARGATWATTLDGGGSSAMAIHARHVVGGWRPVANHIGLKAKRPQ